MDKLLVSLTIVTLTLSATSVWLWRERSDERLRNEQLQARITALESAQNSAPTPNPVATATEVLANSLPPAPGGGATFVVSPNSPPPPPVTPAPMNPSESAARERLRESIEQQQKLMKDPEYRALMVAQSRMGVERMHRDLALLLDLSPEQSDRLLNLLAEQQVQTMADSRSVNFGVASEQARRDYAQNFQAQQVARNAAIKAVLGEAKFGEWQRYEQSAGARMMVNTLRDTLSGTDEPLRQDQLKPLINSLAQEYGQSRNARGAASFQSVPTDPQALVRAMEERLEATAAQHQRIRDAAASTLSSTQLAQLAKQLDQQLNMQRVNARLQQERIEADARNGITPQNSRPVTFVASPGSLQTVEVVTGP